MSSDIVFCVCQSCNQEIEFDAQSFSPGETVTLNCPHSLCDTQAVIPQKKPPEIKKEFSNLTIGDIIICDNKIITPNGTGNLADAQWIFTDASRIESRIPASAVVLAVIFFLFCLLGLLFLLIRESTIVGYVEVSVQSGSLFHKVQIPVQFIEKIDRIRQFVSTAQSMSFQARVSASQKS